MSSSVVDPQRITYPVVSTSDISTNNQVIGYRNRVINGNFRIDQRNVGTAITATNAAFPMDRWSIATTLTNIGPVQQATNNAPIGQTNYLNWNNSGTTTTSTTVYHTFRHTIEGNNIADLRWGSTTPQTITVSFMVFVNNAGIYSFAIRNTAANYSYTTSYTVTTINQWVKVVLPSIPGPPSGSVWNTSTGIGLDLFWGLHGSGTSLTAPATANSNTWSNTNYITTANQINLAGIANASFNLAAVQLEVGTLATAFEWRPYDVEMRACQRYFEKSYDYSAAPGSAPGNNQNIRNTVTYSTSAMWGPTFAVEKRVIPTFNIYNPNSGTLNNVPYIGGGTYTTSNTSDIGTKSVGTVGVNGAAAGNQIYYHFTASAEL